ncbi:MAG TPA: hypothetical protein VEZ50_15760 [Nodosilinea sp.]|jgi:hypothetical protein|nr:hypothetical protein [Nodosilinea sp.]
MSSPNGQLSIGDLVVLSEEGATAHRKYRQEITLLGGAVAGAVLLPLALPGGFLATAGIVSAGAGIAVAGGTQAAVGAAGGAGIFSFIKDNWENQPEAQAIGIVSKINERWFGQIGYDYRVNWLDDSGQRSNLTTFHLRVHLKRMDSPFSYKF